LYPDGGFDATFTPAVGPVHSIAVQPDGRIVVGGGFTAVGGEERNHIARLGADGALEESFDPAVLGNGDVSVSALALQADGKILLGGAFINVSGQLRANMARLTANGNLDLAFDPAPNATVGAVVVQPDGKILVCGLFTEIAGQPRSYIARLNPNGSIDDSFIAPEPNDWVVKMVLQPDGKILAAGIFTFIAGQPRNRLVRLNADGTLDADFNANINSTVVSIALQTDGDMTIGGQFSMVNGQPIANAAQLHADGSVVTGFVPDPDNTVITIAQQDDGKVVIGGAFHDVNGFNMTRNGLARLSQPDQAWQSLQRVNGVVHWHRAGTSPELALPPRLSYSSDGLTFLPIATMSRVADGWSYAGFVPPLDQPFYLRAEGSTSTGGASVSQMSSTVRLYQADLIFASGFE